MCFAPDALPPELPDELRRPDVPGEALTLRSADGAEFAAYAARASASSDAESGAEPNAGAGIVVLPDVRGLFTFYEKLTERFAGLGVDAIAIDYFGRTAGAEHRSADFDFMPHVQATTPAQVAADVAAAASWLRENVAISSLFTVGFCFGGSQSFLQAGQGLGLAGAIGFYGGLVPRNETWPDPIGAAAATRDPILGLFGGADRSIPQEKIDEYDTALDAAGVPHTFHVYPGAPHSFFDRTHLEHQDQCADAWRRMHAFIFERTSGTT